MIPIRLRLETSCFVAVGWMGCDAQGCEMDVGDTCLRSDYQQMFLLNDANFDQMLGDAYVEPLKV